MTGDRKAIQCIACRLGLCATDKPGYLCNHEHEQVVVLDPALRMVTLDVGMVEPVLALWRAGVETTNSCEGGTQAQYLAGLTSRPYIQVRHDQTDFAMRVLTGLGLPWVVEPMVVEDFLPCLVPTWAADLARQRMERVTS